MKKLQALIGGVNQMLHQSGQIKGIMPLVMHRYERITSLLIPGTTLVSCATKSQSSPFTACSRPHSSSSVNQISLLGVSPKQHHSLLPLRLQRPPPVTQPTRKDDCPTSNLNVPRRRLTSASSGVRLYAQESPRCSSRATHSVWSNTLSLLAIRQCTALQRPKRSHLVNGWFSVYHYVGMIKLYSVALSSTLCAVWTRPTWAHKASGIHCTECTVV
jgi:hypothetical protein